MDIYQELASIAGGIISNGLTWVITLIFKGSTGYDEFLQEKLKENGLMASITGAIEKVSETIELHSAIRIEEICLFLATTEVETTIRQIYTVKLSESHGSIDDIRKLFYRHFTKYFGLNDNKLHKEADALFDQLTDACENAFDIVIDKGFLSAHEAKSSLRHKIIMDEIRNIKTTLSFLTESDKPDLQAVSKYVETYRRQVSAYHGKIKLITIDPIRNVPIDKIYVKPGIHKSQAEKVRLTLDEFLTEAYRTVILGNPGAGKSTLVDYMCHKLAISTEKHYFSGRKVTPVLVVLREFTAERSKEVSFLQFIENTANTKYQVKPPQNVFEHMFLNGHAIVIFDGLDELLDSVYRREISKNIESFCNLYPSVPVLVTSREVGYEQAPLDEEMFDIYTIAPFTEYQITEYARKWFAMGKDADSKEQKLQKAEAFLKESRNLRDIITNPLMLSLLCNIYRGKGSLPKNRIDVFARCSTILYEKWDERRGIKLEIPAEINMDRVIEQLAEWIYTDPALANGVRKSALNEKVADLISSRFINMHDASAAAEKFIDYCRGRAWIFTDIGSTGEGEELYQFTHRTFMEYFTARNLVRNQCDPQSLLSVLYPKIKKHEWDIVAQLSCQILDKDKANAGNELLEAFIQKMNTVDDPYKLNILRFMIKCIRFMDPDKAVISDITKLFFANWFSHYENIELMRELLKMLSDLLNAAAMNRNLVSAYTMDAIIEKLKNGNRKEALLAAETGLNLTVPLFFESIYDEEEYSFWKKVSCQIADICSENIKDLSSTDLNISIVAFRYGLISYDEFIQRNCFQNIFEDCNLYYLNAKEDSIVSDALWIILHTKREKSRAYWEKIIRDIGAKMLSSYKSFSVNKNILVGQRSFIGQAEKMDLLNLDEELSFGILVILFVFSEPMDRHLKAYEKGLMSKDELMERVDDGLIGNVFGDSCRNIILTRLYLAKPSGIKKYLNKLGFSKEKNDFIIQWVNHDINLTV
jgi:RNAse (barnase) inhibitor barstar